MSVRPSGTLLSVRGARAPVRLWRALVALPERLGFGWTLVLVCLVGLALRVTYALVFRWQHVPLQGDSFVYTAQANLLAKGNGFVVPLSGIGSRVLQAADHPPFYVAWLAFPAWVDPRGGTSQIVMMLWSCVLGTGTIALCGLAGKEIAGARVGLLAAALAAVYPDIWVHDGSLLSETAALFTAAGILLFAYRFWRRPTPWRAAWLGAWCALGALARSELVLAAPLLLVPLALFARGSAWPRRVGMLGAGVAATALVLAPWVTYNAVRFRDPVLLSTNFGPTLVAANCHATYYGKYMGFKDYTCSSTLTKKVASEHADWDSLDQSQRDTLLRAEATKYMRSHARRVPIVVLSRVARLVGVFHPFQEVHLDRAYYVAEPGVTIAQIITFWIVGAFAIAGAVTLRRRRIPVWPAFAVPVAVLLGVAVTFAQLRYRAPADAAFVVLAAVAIDAWMLRRAARRESFEHVESTPLPPPAAVPVDRPAAT